MIKTLGRMFYGQIIQKKYNIWMTLVLLCLAKKKLHFTVRACVKGAITFSQRGRWVLHYFGL
jgi:hypothetical protein